MATFTYRVSAPVTPIPIGSSFISTLNIGHTDLISDVSLSLIGLSHEWSADLDVMLRYETATEDRTLQVMSDVAEGAAISNATLVFDDSASEILALDPLGPFVDSGIYRPFGTPGETLLDYVISEPATPVATATGDGTVSFASVFDGLAAEGAWSLYVTDDLSGLNGTLQGWSLSFQTNGDQGLIGPVAGTSPVVIAFAPGSGTSGSYSQTGGVEVTYSGVTEWNITTGDGDDVLIAPSVDSILISVLGNDFLQGGSGNDGINAGGGRDTVYAGDGNDSVTVQVGFQFDDLAPGELYDGGSGADVLTVIAYNSGTTFDFRTVTLAGFETLSLVSQSSTSSQRVILNDTQIGPGLSANATINLSTEFSQQTVTIFMGLQNSLNLSGLTIVAPSFLPLVRFEIIGDGSNETLTGTTIADSIEGNSGNDILGGGAGNDSLFGGIGNDILIGGNGADVLSGGSGTDRVQYTDAPAGVVADLSLPGSNSGAAAGDTYSSIEHLYGSFFGDTLGGTDDANVIWGDLGNDALRGYGGDDILLGGAGADAFEGGGGNDRVQYSDATTGLRVDLQVASTNTGIAAGDSFNSVEHLFGSFQSDSLLGDTANNLIWGASGNDLLNGRTGSDTLFGGAGNDTLHGGAGNDVLNGEAGIDVFVFDQALGPTNVDSVSGYSVADDVIQLENAIFTALTATGVLAGTAFISGAAATTAAHRIIYNSATGQLLYDADGTGAGAAVQFATLSTGLALVAGEFLVV